MQKELFSNLVKLPFLAKLPADALQYLADKIKEVKFKKRAVIINEGEETNSLYIILSGKVRIFCSDENSKEVTLAIQESSTSFGILSLLTDEPRSATVETLEPTICGVISKADFMHWFELHPEAAFALLTELTDKIRLLTEKVKQLALSNAYERTVSVLMEMADKEGDCYVIRNKPTQEGLANMVGVTRETINKILHALKEGGYLTIKSKTIRIEKKLPAKF